MFLRMLKKEFKDKIGFNCVLLLMMVFACVFLTLGLTMLYTDLNGEEQSYNACNTSDLVVAMYQDVSDPQHDREQTLKKLEEIDGVEDIAVRSVVFVDIERLVFGDEEQTESMSLSWRPIYLSTMPQTMNKVYSLSDEPFIVQSGHIAIAQHLGNLMNVGIGDCVQITTQFGNVYEFEISNLYKSPSSSMLSALILCEEDYEILFRECPLKTDLYEIQMAEVENYVSEMTDAATEVYTLLGENIRSIFITRVLFLCDDGILNLIVSASLVVVALFLIAIIFITISFTLKSVIKQQEKEIGIMKAIGTYSLSYKALFASKYIALSVIAGLIGLPIALSLCEKMLLTFVYHVSYPSFQTRLLLSAVAIVLCVLFMIGFIFVSLKRMDKISIMDAIRSDSQSDYPGKAGAMKLYKNRSLPSVLFLAISDIVKNSKRYVFLILAYVLGISMIFFVMQGRDSICSDHYIRNYWQKGQIDFVVEVDDQYLQQLVEKSGSVSFAYNLINENLQKNGIDAKIEVVSYQNGLLHLKDEETLCTMSFGDIDLSELAISEGQLPVYEDEVAMSHYHATMNDIQIGDVITLEYTGYDVDGVSAITVQKNFKVVSFFEAIGLNSPMVFMGSEFDNAVASSAELFRSVLNCKDSEYDDVFESMEALYKEDEIRFIHKNDVVSYYLSSYVSILNLLLVVVCTVGAVVFTVLTLLYENIFIEEEKTDVAMLKSIGFSNREVKLWHVLRILILALISVLLALLFAMTLGKWILERIVIGVLSVVEFEPVVSFVSNFIVVPLAFIALIVLILYPVLRHMDDIQIWRVRDE